MSEAFWKMARGCIKENDRLRARVERLEQELQREPIDRIVFNTSNGQMRGIELLEEYERFLREVGPAPAPKRRAKR